MHSWSQLERLWLQRAVVLAGSKQRRVGKVYYVYGVRGGDGEVVFLGRNGKTRDW